MDIQNNDMWGKGVSLQAVPHTDYSNNEFDCTVVNGLDTDLIFQFFKVSYKDFDSLLAEVIEDYFGGTENFALDYVSDLDSYALLAKGIRSNALFNWDHHVTKFLNILQDTIVEVNK